MGRNRKRIREEIDGVVYVNCTKCWDILSLLDNFTKSKKGKWGYTSICKKCIKESREINSEYICKKKKEYYETNKIKIQEKAAIYRDAHRERIKNYARKYRETFPEKCKISNRKSYSKHAEDRVIQQKNYEKGKSKKLWFSWKTFHDKANWYSDYRGLNPHQCQICWIDSKCHLHHPSYSSFDKRKEVVFLCPKCHKNVHEWNLDCPKPVDLIQLNAHMLTILTDKDLKCLNKNKNLNDENGIV